MSRITTITLALVAALVCGALSGCVKSVEPSSTITVIRPEVLATQTVSQYEMETAKAVYAEEPGGWRKLLVGYNLPGSKASAEHPRYLHYLYMRFHAGAGTRQVTPGSGQLAYFFHVLVKTNDIRSLKLARQGANDAPRRRDRPAPIPYKGGVP